MDHFTVSAYFLKCLTVLMELMRVQLLWIKTCFPLFLSAADVEDPFQ